VVSFISASHLKRPFEKAQKKMLIRHISAEWFTANKLGCIVIPKKAVDLTGNKSLGGRNKMTIAVDIYNKKMEKTPLKE